MDRIVKITKKGSGESLIGIPVAEGPSTYRLVLTWPASEEGRVVEIPIDEVESVHEAEAGPRHTEPQVVQPDPSDS